MRKIAILLALFAAIQTFGGELSDAVKNGKLVLNLRYRLESVDQDNLGDDALASTLRTRLGYQFGAYKGWQLLVDFENITSIGDDTYNSTSNGKGTRPVVADPEDTEVNRLQFVYTGFKNQAFVIGRQRIIFDNARFVGNVGWRQNEQTFDGLVWQYKKGKRATFTLAYLDNVNRIFGEHHPNPLNADLRLNSFVAHAKIAKLPVGNLSVFGYFLDIEDLPVISHQDLGLRLNGAWKVNDTLSFVHDLSYATQSDYADGSANIDADYYYIGWGPKWKSFTATANYEVLGGDGTWGFATPVATLHAFNGWADRFLGTPANGLVDTFAKFVYKSKGWTAIVIYHQFDSDEGSFDYGEEWDALLAKKFNKHVSGGLKLADYSAKDFSVDGTKIWAFVQCNW